jgi:hypothetical protein
MNEHKQIMLENNLILTEEQSEFLDFVLSPNFSWYNQTGTSKIFNTFSHTLMARHDEKLQKPGIINSQFYDKGISIFYKFCKDNNIPVNGILRAAFNNTTFKPEKWGDIHIDHNNMYHYNFILYVNESSGSTFVFDNTATELIKEFTFKKNKGIIFTGAPHAQGFCSPYETRVVLVVTFY